MSWPNVRWPPWATFSVAFAVLFLRRPDALLRAQFFAEDGAIWFADAYNHGWWWALRQPYEGYIHLVPRLAAALALLVPMAYAPLIENGTALAIQALPAPLLLSPRSECWGSLRFRSGLALLYLILPNTHEILGSVTESQWVLALCSLLIVVAAAPTSPIARATTLPFLALCSLTGPFSLFLLPFASRRFWKQRDHWSLSVCAVVLCCAAVQGIVLATHIISRQHNVLGASPALLARILGGHIYLGTLMGHNALAGWMSLWPLLTAAAIGTGLVIVSCLLFPPMRTMALFSALLFAAALAHPVVADLWRPAWQTMTLAAGVHYWFLPTLTFAWALAFLVRSKNRAIRAAAGCLLTVMLFGIVRDFQAPPLKDRQWAEYARRVQPHATIVIPQNPAGVSMTLLGR